MKIISFLKNEAVLSIAVLLAAMSALLVPPDAVYLNYIDYRTLGILFCLMAVMLGFQRQGIFLWLAERILGRTKSIFQMTTILVLLCFFFSMFITNDVALITFVPLALVSLELADHEEKEKWMVFVVVMQTIAANLGSMLTPIGNPQNLYLYSMAGMSLPSFVGLMLPYALISLLLLLICVFVATSRDRRILKLSNSLHHININKLLPIYTVLFLLSILVVLRVLDYKVVLLIVLLTVFCFDRHTLEHLDYSLLATFTALFIFIGNIGRLPAFYKLLAGFVNGNELLVGVLCSQITSNVPAALLLSGFTDHFRELTVGVNLGGLGTLIASMASLISFKYIVREDKKKKNSYLAEFTAFNLAFLAVLLPIALF